MTTQKHEKHIWKGGGWRRHVVSWSLMSDALYKWVKRTCSEPNCEVNFEPVVKKPREYETVQWKENRGWRNLGNGARTTTHVLTQNYR